MAKKKLTDPVDENQDEFDELVLEDDHVPEGVLTEDEIGSIPISATKAVHPFDGYPIQRKIKVDKSMIPSTYLIILKDEGSVFQDESGKGVTQAFFKKDPKTGEDIRKQNADGKLFPPTVERTKTIDLGSYHNRVTTHPVTGANIDTVFDRQIQVGNRMRMCAVERSHAARAQIAFTIDKKGIVRVDPRYELADTKQAARLRRVFDQCNYQHMKAERLAKRFEADQSDQDRGAR